MSDAGSNSLDKMPLRGMWQARKANLLVILLYVILTIVVTYPTIFRMNVAIYGGGDNLLHIWATWWRKYCFINSLDYRFLSLSQAPFGTDYVNRWPFPGTLFPMTLLALLSNELASYNLMILGAYALSGIFVFLIADRFSHNKVASFIAGLVFAYSSYAVSHSLEHVDLAQQWVIPLFFLALINLQQKWSIRASFLLGGAFAVACYTHPYYGYHVAVSAVVFEVVETIARYREGGWKAIFNPRRLLLVMLAATIGIVLYSPELLVTLRELHATAQSPLRVGSTLGRSNIWFFHLSSRPWDFVLPPTRHPLLGELSHNIYEQLSNIPRLHFAPPVLRNRYPGLDTGWFWDNSTGSSLYLGYANLVVAGYAIWQWRRNRLTITASSNGQESLWHTYFAILFIVALLFTAPPFLPIGALLRPLWSPLHDVVIPMPSWLTMWIAPPLRDSSRFVVLAFMSLAWFVAVGIRDLQACTGTLLRRLALILVFVGALVFEYAHLPTFTPLTTPAEHLWLAEQPRDTIVAIYPYGNRHQATFQRIHELPVIDSLAEDAAGMRDNIFQIESWTIGSLNHPNIGPKLAALGATYVVNSAPPVNLPPDGLSLLFTTETAQVFEVIAYPAPLVVLYTPCDGLWMSEATWTWQSEEYTITIWNPLNEAAEVDVALTLADSASGAELLATRILTSPPEQIIWSGLLIDNPYIPPDYPRNPATGETTSEGITFHEMLIQPGETTLTLRWSGANEAESYPLVADVHFALTETE